MLKLLFLLPFPPRLDASHGGSRVMAELLVRLAQRHRVALLYLRAADESPLEEKLRERCDMVREVERPIPNVGWRLRLRLLHSFLQRKPIWVTLWSVPTFKNELRSLVREWQPDIIQLEYHVMGQYLPAIGDFPAPRVLTEHEPGTRAARDLEQMKNGYARVMHSLDRRVWDRYERRILREIDTAVVFTEQDRRELWELGAETPIIRIPLQITVPSEPLDAVGKTPLSVLFVGNFIHPPNVDAAEHLVRDILPAVRAEVPDVRLYIVGDRPPAQLKQLANERIIVTGLVPDVTPYLDQAAVVVAPLRTGGGMRVKVLEALAAGKAVVAYPLAVEGLEVRDGQQISIVADDKEFVARIIELLEDGEERRRMGAAAYDWARRNISWRRSVKAYEDLYRGLLRDGSPAKTAPSLLEVI